MTFGHPRDVKYSAALNAFDITASFGSDDSSRRSGETERSIPERDVASVSLSTRIWMCGYIHAGRGAGGAGAGFSNIGTGG